LTGTSTTTGLSSTQAAAVAAYENTTQAKVQSMLDQIVGPGNAKATVTAQLNFDQSTTESKTFGKGAAPSKSFTKSKETYNSPNGSSLLQSGVVGPDGQQDPLAGLGTVSGNGKSKYSSSSETSDQAVDETVTHSIAAPGTVKDLHIMVAVDSLSLGSIQSSQLTQMIGQGIGINAQRGDSVIVDAFPFNRSAQAAAQQELKDAKAAADRKAQIRLFRNIGIGVLIGLLVIALWISRRRTKARQEATTQAVEQLRADVAARAAQRQTTENAALAALDEVEESETDGLREEINALVDEQPEDVAALLRGWLMERPR